jgi:hypothetical protein
VKLQGRGQPLPQATFVDGPSAANFGGALANLVSRRDTAIEQREVLFGSGDHVSDSLVLICYPRSVQVGCLASTRKSYAGAIAGRKEAESAGFGSFSLVLAGGRRYCWSSGSHYGETAFS